MSLVISVQKVSPDGSRYEGEEEGVMLDLEGDKFARPDGPVRYDLFVQLTSAELIVSGKLQAQMTLLCGRCGGFFSTTLGVSAFLRA